MVPVEFQARVENGIIVVPDEYKQSLAEANTVKITVLKQPQKPASRPDIMDELAQTPVKVDRFLTRDEIHEKPASRPDIMDELAQNPVSVPGIRSLTREEMHER